jgi:predicted adenylyl cyclase CyaB
VPTNLELKARIESPADALRVARRIARPGAILFQTDTYFNVRNGRLKLRECSDAAPELIYYERNEEKGERWSRYYVVRLKRKSEMKEILENALERRVVVRKRRRIWFYKNARIHLDTVYNLGYFIEFEVLLLRGRDQARYLLAELIELFRVEKEGILRCSYSELIEKKLKAVARLAR